jgi:hypothetical protein
MGQPDQIEDVVRYSRGSKLAGIEGKSYGTVVAVNPIENILTIQKPTGVEVSYDPKRLSGVSVYRELGMIENIGKDGNIALRLEDGRTVQFNAVEHPHLDHGYAVTSYGSQGLTTDRVLINIDTAANPQLINSRFAYVSVSRAGIDAQIFTDDSSGLGQKLEHDVAKTSAVDFSQSANHANRTRAFALAKAYDAQCCLKLQMRLTDGRLVGRRPRFRFTSYDINHLPRKQSPHGGA